MSQLPIEHHADRTTQKGRAISKNCIVAQRIKRFESIQSNLSREPSMKLSQMQDIGGCLAVMLNVAHVEALVQLYLEDN